MPVFALVTPPVSAFICHLPFLRRSPERMNSLTAMRKRQDATGLRVRARAESAGAHAGKGEATGGCESFYLMHRNRITIFVSVSANIIRWEGMPWQLTSCFPTSPIKGYAT